MNQIKKFKNERGFTFAELCQFLGESPKYEKSLVNIANGKRNIPSAKVIKWSVITGIPGELLRPDIFPHPTQD